MEYEIDDDPQGLPDQSDEDRDGGLRQGRIIFRTGASAKEADEHDDTRDEEPAIRQFGEVA